MGLNVIWIDDEWDTRGTSFIQICKLKHQINISPYKTRKEGIAALESNLKDWDAVILDAKAYNNSEDEVADLDGMYAARERLIELRQQRHIPYFVLTGQPDLMGDKSFGKAVGKFYDKKKPEEVNQLISDLKEEVSKSYRFQIKSIYHDAVEQLLRLNIDVCEDILTILEAMHFPKSHPDFVPRLFYNPMRRALEYVFRALGEVGIIPEVFFSKGAVHLNQCFMFLIGRDAEKMGYRYGNAGDRVVPRHIHDMMSLIINLGNTNSHSTNQSHITELSEAEVQRYENQIISSGVNSRFMIFSMALQFCEIVQWMNIYKNEHPDKAANLAKCVKIEVPDDVASIQPNELIGIVEMDNKLFHVGNKFGVHPGFVSKHGLVGKKVKILKYDVNIDERAKEYYPYYASVIQPLEE